MLKKPEISAVAAKKLAMIGRDFMGVSKDAAMEIIRAVRDRRTAPPVKAKKVKAPKAPKMAKEKKPRKPRVKKNGEGQKVEGEASTGSGFAGVNPGTDEAAQ